jgi:outer membrane protein OmpA-like peptidoglycan-associated protein
MPAVILGIKRYFNDNRDEINGLLAASFQAADQVKAFDAVRRNAGEISAKLYKDQTGDYWYKYYNGVHDSKSGQLLGGSAVFNLEDDVNYFGLDGKHNNNMRATYETFGKIATMNYPQLFKDNPVPAFKDAVDTSFIFGAQSLLNTGGVQGASAETVDYSKEVQNGQVLGHKAVYINFASGSDQPLPDSLPTLSELKDSLAINSQLALQIDGYTDNAGSDSVNLPLSEKRAQAVKRYFQQTAPLTFPESRFKLVAGHGSQSPIASNASGGGKALNRRVEITQIGQ